MLDVNTLTKLANSAAAFQPPTVKSKQEQLLQAVSPMMLVIAIKGGKTSDIFQTLIDSDVTGITKPAISTYMRTRLKPLVDYFQRRSISLTVPEAIALLADIRDRAIAFCPSPDSKTAIDIDILPEEFVKKHLELRADNPTVKSSVYPPEVESKALDRKPAVAGVPAQPSAEPPKAEAPVEAKTEVPAPAEKPVQKPTAKVEKPTSRIGEKPPKIADKPEKKEPVSSTIIEDDTPSDDDERKAIAAAERDMKPRRRKPFTKKAMLEARVKSPEPVSWAEFMQILDDSGISTSAPRNALLAEGHITNVDKGYPMCVKEHELFIGMEEGKPVLWMNLRVKPSAINFVRIFGDQ